MGTPIENRGYLIPRRNGEDARSRSIINWRGVREAPFKKGGISSCNPKILEVGLRTSFSTQPKADKLISLGRHSRNCGICAHKHREEIEREFINWTGPKAIAKEYGLKDRATVYRHAHAFGLFVKRRRNIRAAQPATSFPSGIFPFNAQSHALDDASRSRSGC